MKHIDCEKYAQEILDEVKKVPNKGKLVIITVGDDPASQVYVRGKIKDCEYCGIPVEHIQIEDSKFVRIRLKMTILKNNMYLLLVSVFACLPVMKMLRWQLERFCGSRKGLRQIWNVVLYSVIPVILLLLSTAALVGDSYNPFIYFQF